ncbi:unnamed protein product [Nezara viridula]|uniref:Uncharacterized protein n=1 Tax=Nezara viridula TaxID=85310 RepID=A0A9P0H4Y2_NEZVI|nr:unnamed protein product [Nezara viridula]
MNHSDTCIIEHLCESQDKYQYSLVKGKQCLT